MQLYIGSTNPAKVRQLAAALEPCGVRVAVTGGLVLPQVVEDAERGSVNRTV